MKVTRRGFLKMMGIGGPAIAVTAHAKLSPVKGLEALFRKLPEVKRIEDGQVILKFDPNVMYGNWMKSGIKQPLQQFGEIVRRWRPSPKPGKEPGDLGYYSLAEVPQDTMDTITLDIKTFIPKEWRINVVIDLSASGDIIWWRYLPPDMSWIRVHRPEPKVFFPHGHDGTVGVFDNERRAKHHKEWWRKKPFMMS